MNPSAGGGGYSGTNNGVGGAGAGSGGGGGWGGAITPTQTTTQGDVGKGQTTSSGYSGAGNRGFQNNVAFPGSTATMMNPIQQSTGQTAQSYIMYAIVAIGALIAFKMFHG